MSFNTDTTNHETRLTTKITKTAKDTEQDREERLNHEDREGAKNFLYKKKFFVLL